MILFFSANECKKMFHPRTKALNTNTKLNRLKWNMLNFQIIYSTFNLKSRFILMPGMEYQK